MPKRFQTKLAFTVLTALLIIAFVFPVNGAGEVPRVELSKTYGGYVGYAVIQTADGGYAVAGENATYSFEGRGYGDYAPLLIKTDASGEVQWGKTYGSEFGVSGGADSVVQTRDLGYALCGKGWLLKTDAQGNVKWNKTLSIGIDGYAFFTSIIRTNDEGFVLTGRGYFANNSGFGELLKTDENGNILWNRIFAVQTAIGPPSVSAYSAVQTNDGGYAVVGGWNSKSWFAKIDANGNLELNKTYADGDLGSIAKAKDGGYILCGRSGFGGVGWLIKVDSLGNMLWNQSFSGSVGDYWLGSAEQTCDGGYIAAGALFTSDDDYAFLVRTDSSGKVLWNATYGGSQDDRANSIVITDDGGYAFTGTRDNNVWLAKFAPELPNTGAFPITWIVAAVVIVAVVGVGLVVYFTKVKKKRLLRQCEE
jgi:hypothetical protein